MAFVVYIKHNNNGISLQVKYILSVSGNKFCINIDAWHEGKIDLMDWW